MWNWMKDVPFAKHRGSYITLKIVVLVAATLLALHYFGAI